MRSDLAPFVVVAAALGAAPAVACGPDFPARLLADRARTMSELVEGSFAWEAAHLVAAPAAGTRGAYRVVEGAEPPGARDGGSARERALYDEGARSFRAGDREAAARAFRQFLALPKAERRVRSTWAAFMLGRVTGDPPWFRRVRALVDDGFEDALGLAAASLGEEARIDLARGEVAPAVRLYAQQAALGSASGEASLLFVARSLASNEKDLERAVKDPIVQRLVAAYLFARGDEVDEKRAAAFLAAVDARGLVHVEAADLLAAAAYRAGRFALARRFVDKAGANSALASWVKAKLDLRDGRVDDADADLSRASRRFPAAVSWGEALGDDGGYEALAPRRRVDGERALLALARGDGVTALDLLMRGGSTYWLDAAYVAERVLGTDELISYVETHDAKPAPASPGTWFGDGDAPGRLRTLLARRLVREQRFAEAARFFDDASTRAAARDYAAALARSSSSAGVDAAEARFRAATILRAHGLAISGTELDPDWAAFGGEFDLGDVEHAVRHDVLLPAPGAPWTGPAERTRVAATAAQPLVRFHYRAAAADLAWRAADLLPPRSQAFAAILCKGSSWLLDREPERATRFWDRYVERGAAVDFAATFGRACPAPDFERARRPPRVVVHRAPPRNRALARDAAALLGLVVASGAFARALARRRAAPVHPAP